MIPPNHIFSKRSDWPVTLNPIAALLNDKRKSGVNLIDLTGSNPTSCGFSFYSEDRLKVLSEPGVLEYEPHPAGLPAARQAVCGYYGDLGVKVRPDDVFLTAGTSEAYGHLFRLLADPGDRIACAHPSYPLLSNLADIMDVRLAPYHLKETERGWHPELGPLEGQKVRALVLVHPNNPTGNYADAADRRMYNEYCLRHQTALIVDEVFMDFAWKPREPSSFADNEEVLTFTLSGISKVLALPQMKLSWIVLSGPETLRRAAAARLEIMLDAYLSVNTPVQRALAAWLPQRPRVCQEILERVRANFLYLTEALRKEPVATVSAPEGGWVAVLSARLPLEDQEICLGLLRHQNVLVHPGFFYDFEDDRRLVLSLILPIERFREGVRRLVAGLKGMSV